VVKAYFDVTLTWILLETTYRERLGVRSTYPFDV